MRTLRPSHTELDRRHTRRWPLFAAIGAVLIVAALAPAREPFAASEAAIAVDQQINWKRAALLIVQDRGRYKTLDSFARESLVDMYGTDRLPGLSPLGSLCEWLFNHDAYADTPVIRIRDRGLQLHFTDGMPEAARQRIRATGFMTPRELADPAVQKRMDELEPRFEMGRAIGRVRSAEAVARFIDQVVRIVPHPGAPADAPWYTPQELTTNAALALPAGDRPADEELVRRFGQPAADVTPEQAVAVIAPWQELQSAWQRHDAPGVQAALDRLADALPTLAAAGVYPDVAQRRAEARYYANFISNSIFARASLGWCLYLVGALVSVVALVTHWRTPRICALLLLVMALAWHAYGLGLRWYIVGRIPVANMFEALTASAWIGIVLALLVELVYRTHVFLLAAHATGFCALIVASYVLPLMGSSGGELTTVMGILDDLMLRIHTVLIIASYALIFLAAVIAVVYLFGYYFHTQGTRSAQAGLIAAGVGALLWVVLTSAAFQPTGAVASGVVKVDAVRLASAGAAALTLGALILLSARRAPGLVSAGLALLFVALLALTFGGYGFTRGVAAALIGGGVIWAALSGMGQVLRSRWSAREPAAPVAVAVAGTGRADAAWAPLRRPVLAGGAPGDDGTRLKLPEWLQHTDWSHLIILNMAFVMLFVGIILGAVWADYSWGRPWGWDPKETFAINTWIIYAILIHSRFVARRKGLWTAWLSVGGCAMMAFNWFVVNFYIVGLHSYA